MNEQGESRVPTGHGIGSVGGEVYVLSTGDAGESRLEMLNTLYGRRTEELLEELGIAPGMRVADVGCGVGTIVAWEAGRVAPGGIAVGIDKSEAQLDEATKRAAASELGNVQVVCASAYAIDLPDASFEIVGCRSLLSHLVDPQAAVREMARLVKPGGFLICEDIDMRTIHTDPPSRAYDRIVELYYALGDVTNCDYSVGARLADLIAAAGLEVLGSRSDQPGPRTGDAKRWWELTFIETAPAMKSAGVLTDEEFTSLCAQIAPLGMDTTTAIFQPRHFQSWGRKAT